jgi:hypothetical protein
MAVSDLQWLAPVLGADQGESGALGAKWCASVWWVDEQITFVMIILNVFSHARR